MRFATMVVKVVIHHMLRDFDIQMRPGYRLQWDMTALPTPIDDFPVRIRRRGEVWC
jgi:cytochrome P450